MLNCVLVEWYLKVSSDTEKERVFLKIIYWFLPLQKSYEKLVQSYRYSLQCSLGSVSQKKSILFLIKELKSECSESKLCIDLLLLLIQTFLRNNTYCSSSREECLSLLNQSQMFILLFATAEYGTCSPCKILWKQYRVIWIKCTWKLTFRGFLESLLCASESTLCSDLVAAIRN